MMWLQSWSRTDLVSTFLFSLLCSLPLIFCSFSGGPKLRKWYGAPDILEKDGTAIEDNEDDYPGEQIWHSDP